MKGLPLASLMCLMTAAPASSWANGNDNPNAPAARRLDRVSVTATRLRAVDGFDTPAAISRRLLDDTRQHADVQLSEQLGGLPGVVARERQNYAQDTQLSIRGFGARSTFGVRGLRILYDGLPASLPDGQGQLSHIGLPGTASIEVLRGPFSVLHGNAAGGVLQVESARASPGLQAGLRHSAGRDGSRHSRLIAAMGGERQGLAFGIGAFDSDGFREHSATRRRSGQFKWHAEQDDGGHVELVGHWLDLPLALDPLGLGEAQWREQPRQAVAAATQFNTRKTVTQEQLGLRLLRPLGAQWELHALVHGGRREVEQFLAVPTGAQANPLSAGGVIDLDNRYAGGELRATWSGAWRAGGLEASVGVQQEGLDQARRGFENFSEDRLGVRGALRRDERNRVDSRDRYAQLWAALSPRTAMLLGVRRSGVQFLSDDRYLRPGNPDDSGRLDYAETSPVAGVVFSPSAHSRLYMSWGRGFETPTFNELAYRADGAAGLAVDLAAARSRHVEAGFKWRRDGLEASVAVFHIDTRNELAVARNVAGRSRFRNIGETGRRGIELALAAPFAAHWRLDLALGLLDARFADDIAACGSSGCSLDLGRIPAGTRLPGIPARQGSARLQYDRGDWRAALELTAYSGLSANDAGSARAPGYALAAAEFARSWTQPNGRLRLFARLDNLFDRRHVGSVIVNEANGRYYEPGPGRGLLMGLQWDWRQ